MSKFFENKTFNIGTILGLVLFLLIQVYSYIDLLNKREEISRLSDISIDIVSIWGFPLPNFYGSNFVTFGIFGNVVIASVFSFIVGLIFKFVWSNITAQKLK